MVVNKKLNHHLPARLIDTKTGLVFEWGLGWRVRVNETSPAVADFQFAAQLLESLYASDWVPPPSLKKPDFYPKVVPGLKHISVKTVQRAWTQAIAHRYGLEVVKLGLRVFPKSLDLFLLSQIKGNQKILKQRLLEHPHLGPLLSIDTSMWSHLADWRSVKNRFIAMGMVKKTWRWLCRQNASYIAQIDWTQLNQISWVNLHASIVSSYVVRHIDQQTACIKGFGALTSWVRANHDNLYKAYCVSVLRALKLAVEHLEVAENQESRIEIVLEEFPLIADWLRARVGIDANYREKVGRNWTYNTLVTKQAHWHLYDLVWAEPNQNIFWPEHLGFGTVAADTQFSELTSLNALLQESKKMHHCVPSYLDRCVKGEVVLFHLHKTGRKPERATLELSRSGAAGWAITQLKGPCNAPVSQEMWVSSQLVLQRMLIKRT